MFSIINVNLKNHSGLEIFNFLATILSYFSHSYIFSYSYLHISSYMAQFSFEWIPETYLAIEVRQQLEEQVCSSLEN